MVQKGQYVMITIDVMMLNVGLSKVNKWRMDLNISQNIIRKHFISVCLTLYRIVIRGNKHIGALLEKHIRI